MLGIFGSRRLALGGDVSGWGAGEYGEAAHLRFTVEGGCSLCLRVFVVRIFVSRVLFWSPFWCNLIEGPRLSQRVIHRRDRGDRREKRLPPRRQGTKGSGGSFTAEDAEDAERGERLVTTKAQRHEEKRSRPSRRISSEGNPPTGSPVAFGSGRNQPETPCCCPPCLRVLCGESLSAILCAQRALREGVLLRAFVPLW